MLLVVTMLSNTIMIKASSASTVALVSDNNISSEETLISETRIIGEVSEKREKYTKHFIKEDLTYEAAVYPFPVHYNKDGKWSDIDNTLSDATDEQGKVVLQNNENDYKTKFAKNSYSDKLVSLEKDKYELSWNLKDAQKSDASVKAIDEGAVNSSIDKNVEEFLKSKDSYTQLTKEKKEEIKRNLVENEKKKNLTKAASIINYFDILPKVDLQYVLEGDRIKENIILKEKTESPNVTFNFKVKNLVPKLNKDNTISFYDSKDNSKKVFEFQAPFMIDDNGEQSTAVKLELTESKGEYNLTIKPDSSWISDSRRKFPIVIDPPVLTSPNAVKDTFIASSDTADKDTNPYLRVGKHSVVGQTISFIKFDPLPTLSSAK